MEENALQFIIEMGIQNLRAFISSPISSNLRLLICAPALHAIAERELNDRSTQIDATTLEVFRWIYIRAFVVLHQLKDQGSVAGDNVPSQPDEWQKVVPFHRVILILFNLSEDWSMLWNAPTPDARNVSQPSLRQRL